VVSNPSSQRRVGIMGEVLRLRIGASEAGWQVALEPWAQTATPRHISGVQLDTLRAALASAGEDLNAAMGRGPLVATRDAAVTRAEEGLGRVLGEAVLGHAAFARTLGMARGAGDPTVIAIDALGPDLPPLPWELLAEPDGRPPLEAHGQAVVVRLVEGPRAAELAADRRQVRTVLVHEAGEDPQVQRVVEAIERTTEALGLSPPVAHLAQTDPGDLVIVHVVAHGEQLDGLFSLTGSGQGAGTLVSRLGDLARADLVVVGICQGGRLSSDGVAELPQRLLSAGCRACVAPRGPLRTAALEVFVSGLYHALVGGEDLVTAVASARRRVRSEGMPHPDARWHRFGLTLGDLRWVSTPPRLVEGWRPAGWPLPGAASVPVLLRVRALGAEEGFVGIEHLMLALAEAPGLGYRLRMLLEQARPPIAQLMGRLTHTGRLGAWTGTPGLQALGSLLTAGFSVADLGRALEHGAADQLRALVPAVRAAPPSGSPETQSVLAHRVGATAALEVLLGPEGGRRLPAIPGATIGRWDPGTQVEQALYQGTAVADRTLSRQALRWRDAGVLEDTRTSEVLELTLDLPFLLGRGTWLVARGAPP